jgi:hypothetical protein
MFACRPIAFVYGYVDPPGALLVSCSGGVAPQSATITVNGATFGLEQRAAIQLTATSGGSFVPANGIAPWYLPQAGAPIGIWVKATVTAGTGWSTGSIAWQSIDGTTVSWVWTRASVGTTTATVKLEFATDSGGANIVATQTGLAVSVTVI